MPQLEHSSASDRQGIRDNAARVQLVPRSVTGAYKAGSLTGTIAAALGAGSAVFASRLDPGVAVDFRALLKQVQIRWTTIVAFTTSVTAGRRLALFRGSGAAPTGGTQLTVDPRVDTNHSGSEFYAAQGGETRIATTGALGVAGITFEAEPFAIMSLVHVGAAGGFAEFIWQAHHAHNRAMEFRQGELWAIRNPVAMDAAGTWQITVDWAWDEIAPAIY